MASTSNIKAILFDIGGVVVLSPLQAILDFERKTKIPKGWINFAIRYSSPDGFWQRLERGEIKLDEAFFRGFGQNLQNREAWQEFNAGGQDGRKTLKETVNPTQLGDHTSLKDETAGPEVVKVDHSSQSQDKDKDRPSLSKLAKDTTIGDPVSLESEDVVESAGKSNISGSRTPSSSGRHSQSRDKDDSLSKPPKVNGEDLFWSMMSMSDGDPHIYPAVQRISQQKGRPTLGALSNTVNIPPDHPRSRPGTNVQSLFDVYVASANEGMRKPSKEIYELALRRLCEADKKKGGDGNIQAGEVVFLDDIGENLQTAKAMGMKTIKVQLGKTFRSVKELENLLDVSLVNEKTRGAKL